MVTVLSLREVHAPPKLHKILSRQAFHAGSTPQHMEKVLENMNYDTNDKLLMQGV